VAVLDDDEWAGTALEKIAEDALFVATVTSGCAQRYHLTRPLPGAEIAAWRLARLA